MGAIFLEKFLNLRAEKQDAVIDAALVVFGRNGYKKASVSDIAAAAGISKAMVFHYFGSKKNMYLYLTKYCVEYLMNKLETEYARNETDFFKRVQLFAQIKSSAMKKHPSIFYFLKCIHSETDQAVEADIKEFFIDSEILSRKIAFDGTDLSKFKEGIEPALVLKLLMRASLGYVNNVQFAAFSDIDEYMEELNAYIDLFKRNFYKEEPTEAVSVTCQRY
jgi:AcrR family transcriptional regulator